jgi:hypothetical protein
MGEEKVKKLRCSSLPAFMACPSSQLPATKPLHDTSEASELGTAVHEDLARMVVGNETDHAATAAKYGCDVDELEWLFSRGVEAWEDVHQHFENPEVELEMGTRIGDVVLTGHPDLYQDAVLDWKSGRLKYNTRWQLNGYGRLTGVNLGATVWLRFGKTEKVKLMTSAEFDARLLEQIEKIGKEWAVGDHCAYCPRRLECDVREREMEQTASIVKAPITTLSRPELARIHPILKQMAKQIDSALEVIKEDVRQNGPLDLGNGQELAFSTAEMKAIDPLKGWPALSGALSEEELAGCLKVAKGKLKAAVYASAERGEKAKEYGALMGRLEEAGALKVSEKVVLGKRAVSNGK